MIRLFEPRDYLSVIDIWKSSQASLCPWLTTAEAVSKDLAAARLCIVCEQQGEVTGFAYVDPPNNDEVHFFIITHPQWQQLDQIAAIWENLSPHINHLGARKVTIAFLSDWQVIRDFFIRQGFRRKLLSYRMEYHGEALVPPRLEARAYKEHDFTHVLKILNEGFYDLRKEYDMCPHLLYDDSAFSDPLVMQRIAAQDLMVFEANGEIVGYLDPAEPALAVAKAHRTKGYGSDIARFCVNLQLAKGMVPYLYVVSSNILALRMYEKLGYVHVSTTESLSLVNGAIYLQES